MYNTSAGTARYVRACINYMYSTSTRAPALWPDENVLFAVVAAHSECGRLTLTTTLTLNNNKVFLCYNNVKDSKITLINVRTSN